MRAIDGDRLKRKAQEVATQAWKMNVTARVETVINQAIDWIDAMPTIEPEREKGKWIDNKGCVVEMRDGSPIGECWCSECGEWLVASDEYSVKGNFCPNCGADMRTPVEIARNIVHKVIDNTVWSDTVDTAKMHKVVDDKYAEIRGDANVDAES